MNEKAKPEVIDIEKQVIGYLDKCVPHVEGIKQVFDNSLSGTAAALIHAATITAYLILDRQKEGRKFFTFDDNMSEYNFFRDLEAFCRLGNALGNQMLESWVSAKANADASPPDIGSKLNG